MIALRQLPRALPLALAALVFVPAAFAQDVAFPVAVAKPVHHAAAPKPATPATNSNLIVLDPGHGGSDDGAHLANNFLEKDVNAAFAERLKEALTSKGFTVIITRAAAAPGTDADAPVVAAASSEDQRAEQANRLHPAACLLLHATSAGHGVHLFTSSLAPITVVDQSPAVLSWNEAQAPTVGQSLRLATSLSTALNGVRVPLVLGRASVSPIDSLTCPAVTVEIAPLAATAVTDAAYQTRVADAIASSLVFWRGQLETEAAVAASTAAPKPDLKTSDAPVKKLATPKKSTITPDAGDDVPKKAAPIVRRPPESVPPPEGAR